MSGFFSKKETQSKSRPDGKVLSCAACGLYKNAKSPRMEPFGNFRKGILNIGEAPGEQEDRRGKPWQGKTGRLLQKTYEELGIDLFEDCLNINAVNCRPENNRTPTNNEINCCRSTMVSKVLNKYQPKVIVLLGNAALQSFIGYRWIGTLGGIMKWRGWEIPDQEQRCWVIPTFHPSYVERSEREAMTIWKQDLQKAILKADTPFLRVLHPSIQYIKDLSVLDSLHGNASVIAFDYETTGLKPQAPGHKIICASVAVDEKRVYTFMMPKTKSGSQPFVDLLTDPVISKMAHNIKFEDNWTKKRLREDVQNWTWDSMQAAHILDNRQGVTGLKFQTYVNFGVMDYASEVTPYLKATSGDEKLYGGNAINRIQELLDQPGGEEKVLKYCALDSFYERMLAMKQIKELDYDFLPF